VIEAVIFDMDGLIVDSETPEYLAWRATYATFGLRFPLASWRANIGRNDGPFDPLGPFRLEGGPGPPDAVVALWRRHHAVLEQAYLRPLPGVVDLLEGLGRGGVRAGVASSSRIARVRGLLATLGLASRFVAVAGGDEVARGKPSPDVYLLAASRLGATPASCVALEDSENGVRAAKAAGMRCIAVPSALTRGLDFSAADLVVRSLTEVTAEMLATVGGLRGARRPPTR